MTVRGRFGAEIEERRVLGVGMSFWGQVAAVMIGLNICIALWIVIVAMAVFLGWAQTMPPAAP